MANINNPISENNIKLRWNEPYISEASNIQSSVNSPGVYRGGLIEQTTPSSSQMFRITKSLPDLDTTLLHFNSVTGIATVVRFPTDIVIDISSWFPVVSDQTWYVSISISYAHGGTSGDIVVSDTFPSSDNIILGIIDIPSGASTILNTYVRYDIRTRPANKRGMIIEKSSYQIGHGTGTTISDRVYLKNITGQTDKTNSRIQLYQGGASLLPLVGSDGGKIGVAVVRKSSGGDIIRDSDLDEWGCYLNPYIDYDFSKTESSFYVGMVYINYHGFSELDSIPATNKYQRKSLYRGTHAEDVFTKRLNLSSDAKMGTVPSGPLTDVLATLFTFMQHKVDIKQQPASTRSWLPIWQSNDGDNIGVSSKLYWRDGRIALVYNGRFSTSDNVTSNEVGPSSYCKVLDISNSSIREMVKFVSGSTGTYNINTPGDWDYYQDSSVSGGSKIDTIQDYKTTIMQGSGLILLLALETLGIRVYALGQSPGHVTNAFVIIINATITETAPYIYDCESDNNAKSSTSLMLYNDSLVIGIKKPTASIWGFGAGWDVVYTLGSIHDDATSGQFNNCFSVSGDIMESFRLILTNKAPFNQNSASFNYRNRWAVIPSSHSITRDFGDDPTYYVLDYQDKYGGYIYAYLPSLGDYRTGIKLEVFS